MRIPPCPTPFPGIEVLQGWSLFTELFSLNYDINLRNLIFNDSLSALVTLFVTLQDKSNLG